MELDELLALMAASIFAADEGRNTGAYGAVAIRAVRQAELIWKCVIERKTLGGPVYAVPARGTPD